MLEMLRYKGLNYKKLASICLLIFCVVFVIVLAMSLFSYLGANNQLLIYTSSGNYQSSIARYIPTVTIKNCIAKTKLNVVDNEKNHCRYVCFAGIVGRFSCGSYNYESISTVEIAGCVAQIDSDSSIKITKATKSSHPTMCYDLWEYAPSGKKNNYISKLNNLMSQKMTKNYYIDSGYSYDNYSYTAKL